MAKKPELRIYISHELDKQLRALAEADGRHRATIVREILQNHVAKNNAVDGLDVVAETVRRVIRAELKRSEDRLAKIGVKNTLAAATSMFLNLAALDGSGKNSAEWYKAARKKAVSYLRSSDDSES